MKYQKECELFAENLKVMQKTFRLDGTMMHMCCALMYAAAGRVADPDQLVQCRKLIRSREGVISPFRGYAEAAEVCRLVLSGNPERMLENSLAVYQLLKKELKAGRYLPLASMTIAQMAEPHEYERVVQRTRAIYKRMKQEHRILTGPEDSTFCALMALSDRPDEALIKDMESCYVLLKPQFFSANQVQFLSSILALYTEAPEEKCRRVMELFAAFRTAGRRYGTSHELATLGIAAMLYEDMQEAAEEIISIDTQLKSGIFPMTQGKKYRLMFAALLASCARTAGIRDFSGEDTAGSGGLPEEVIRQAMEVNTALSIIIAQQVAMMAVIASTAANNTH